MGLIDEEVVVAVAGTAAALSPRARSIARKGVVYGLAGVMKAGDVVASAARGAARGVQSTSPPEPRAATPARRRTPPRSARSRGAQPRSGGRARGATDRPAGNDADTTA